ncbi:hypothetical protein ABIB73_002069 [Bradyrhizobium sp. F1.4.3]|uniref:STM3941 family protein n=1 Tax=Bradyrhizobium sp. F1.4.3 TaxID=3156356 RepID=UPI0033927C66
MSVGQNSPNLAIGYSRVRLLKLFGAGLLLTLLCAALAFNWHLGKNITTFQIAACYVGVAFFGLATCKMLWTLISSREPVVFISRVGIRDTRLADETIAWSSVRDILIWQHRTQTIVVLKVDPLVAERFAGGFLKRVLSLMNRALGANGVILNAGGLTMDAETLFDTCKQYWAAGRSAYPGRSMAEPEPEPVS